MVPDYDHIAETETGELEFFAADGRSLGVYDSVASFEDWYESQRVEGRSSGEGDGSQGAVIEASGDNAGEDTGSDDSGRDTASVGASSGDDAESNEVSGDTGGIDETGNVVTVENWPTDYATAAQLETVASDLVVIQDHLGVVSASMTILVVLVAACFGVLAVQTLIRSFENW